MKECDIWGSKHTLTPPTYSDGVKTPNPQRLYALYMAHVCHGFEAMYVREWVSM